MPIDPAEPPHSRKANGKAKQATSAKAKLLSTPMESPPPRFSWRQWGLLVRGYFVSERRGQALGWGGILVALMLTFAGITSG